MYTKKSLLNGKYVWGEIVNVHEIGNYLIVEYKNCKDDEHGQDIKGTYDGTNSFHPYVDGHDTNCSFDTLDKAIIHAISCYAGHSRASEFIINMLSFSIP